MTTIINCKELAAKIKDKVKDKIEKNNYDISMLCLTNPNDEAGKVYVGNKRKACDYVGIKFYEAELTEKTPNKIIKALLDTNIPVIVQKPYADGVNKHLIDLLVNPKYDADGLAKNSVVNPCTANAVLEIIDSIDYSLDGKMVLLVGRGELCNKPLINKLLDRNASVMVAHSHTSKDDLDSMCNIADVVITAVGKPNLITGDMIKEGSFIIDVAICRNDNGKLCGDVDFDSVNGKAGYITKVPGGVGLLTVACLMKNVLRIHTLKERKLL